jgi:hypothetical protein
MSGWEGDPVPARFGTIRSLKVVQYKPSGDRVPSRPEICSGLRRIVQYCFLLCLRCGTSPFSVSLRLPHVVRDQIVVRVATTNQLW